VESEVLLPRSQGPAVSLHPETDESSLRSSTLFLKIHPILLLTSMLMSRKLSLSLRLSSQNFACILRVNDGMEIYVALKRLIRNKVLGCRCLE
jgi:hypothetical protein